MLGRDTMAKTGFSNTNATSAVAWSTVAKRAIARMRSDMPTIYDAYRIFAYTALATLIVLALIMSTAHAKPCGRGHIANNRECHR